MAISGLQTPSTLAASAANATGVAPATPAQSTPDGFLTGPTTGDPLDIALAYLRAHAADFGLLPDDLNDVVVKDRYVSKHNGVTHIYLRQRLGGLEVFNGDINVNITRDGRIINIGTNFVHNLQQAANTTTPTLTAADAVRRTAQALGMPAPQSLTPLGNDRNGNAQFSGGGVSRANIPVRLMFQPLATGKARLAWEMQLQPTNSEDWLSVRTDAVTGDVLAKNNFTVSEHAQATQSTGGSYRVPTQPASAPATAADPNSYLVYTLPKRNPFDGDRTLVTDPADSAASPYGWHDTNGQAGAEYTTTRGNNTFTYADLAAPDGFDAGDTTYDAGSGLVFNPPIDLTQEPRAYTDATLTQLFYTTNTLHDILYHYGFDEASGNFQQNNYGHGGAGGDYVKAEAQDYSGTNNANFRTLPDGQPARMQMYLGNTSHILTINAPADIAGNYTSGTSTTFGPQRFNLVDNVVLVNDGTVTTTDGCEPLTNGAAIAGNIALIDRGACDFVVKAKNAQNAKAAGVIIINNVAAGGAMGMGGTDSTITIPVLSLSLNDGTAVKAELAKSTTVNVTMERGATRDGSLDTEVVIHEYGHGLSNRLTGGPANAGCLASYEQAGEGWSDFLSMVLTAQQSDTRATPRMVGNWLVGDAQKGPGIRRYPYSTDMAVNPETYDTLKSPNASGMIGEPHDVGEVWASMLWEVYWNLVDKQGFNDDMISGQGGNNRALQLVIDGMTFQPCNPTFVQARDAILAANQVNSNGADQCAIWEGFAKRGLGYSAQARSTDSVTDGTQAFDLPPTCTISVDPPTVDVCTNVDASYAVMAGSSMTGPVTFSVPDKPAGTSVAFSPNPVAAAGSSTLTVSNSAGLSPGEYAFHVTGTNTKTYTATAALNIANAAPGATTLTSPANNESDVQAQPVLTWAAASQGASYKVEVARDAGFATVVESAVARTTSYTLEHGLISSTSYYWRVTPLNGCGAGAVSPVAMFTVRTVPRVLLVAGDSDPDVFYAYSDALDAIGVEYDVWDTSNGIDEPNGEALRNYATVIWAAGLSTYPGPDAEAGLTDFLNRGSCLFMSSEEYVYNRGVTPFMHTYLGVASGDDDAIQTTVTGAGPVFGDFGTYTLALPQENHSDRISPDSTAVLAFSGNNSSGTVDSGVQKDGGHYRTMFWGFGFEGLPEAARQDAMQRILNWCSFQSNVGVTRSAMPSEALRPGQPLTYTLAFSNTGVAIAQGALLTDTLPVKLADVHVTSSTPITQVAGVDLAWQLGDLAPGAAGTITVTGKIVPDTNKDVAGAATATITSQNFDTDAANNTAARAFAATVPQARFSSATYRAGEADSSAMLTVTLDVANPHADVTLAYATSDGSARAGSNYAAASGTLTIPAGQTQIMIPITIMNDQLSEGDKTLAVTLSDPSGAALAMPSTATLTIVDDGTAITGGVHIYLPTVMR
jgi:uncharacterized repeat protein (TIGR01451 family)